jgi:cobalamin biosynthesis protein CobT
MSYRVVTLPVGYAEADGMGMIGKIINVYDSYAHALAHGSAGLETVKDVDRLTGDVGDTITQTAKTAGPTVDVNGKLVIALEDGSDEMSYWLKCDAGRWGAPRKITVCNAQSEESSSSESSNSSSSQSSASSQSSDNSETSESSASSQSSDNSETSNSSQSPGE